LPKVEADEQLLKVIRERPSTQASEYRSYAEGQSTIDLSAQQKNPANQKQDVR